MEKPGWFFIPAIQGEGPTKIVHKLNEIQLFSGVLQSKTLSSPHLLTKPNSPDS
jgi:hypothetical protein